MKNLSARLIVCTLALLARPAAGPAVAQDIGGATSPSPLQVLLIWSPDTSGAAVRFNLYRKLATATSYPSTPLNSTPLAPITNCATFQTIIPSGSSDWVKVANALADTTGGVPPIAPLSNVCTITSYPPGSSKWKTVEFLAGTMPAVARVMGQGYIDNAVVSGTPYTYQVRRVTTGGTELPLTGMNEITITAGVPESIPAPTGVRLVVDDAKIQVLWDQPTLARFRAFNVYRSSNSIGPFRKVNDVDVSGGVTYDIDSNAVSSLTDGFTDYERWDTSGNPAPRTVPGNPTPFTGPANGTTYWYKVAHKDLFGNVGPLSSAVSGTPVDKTPPATPQNIVVDPVESNSSFKIQWSRVRLDIAGHAEKVAKYRVYRYATPSDPTGGTFVSPEIPQPGAGDSTIVLVQFDSTGGLRSACRDSTLYFRVEAIDAASNQSSRSVAVGAALKDTTRPAVVKGTDAEGFDDYIRVKWKLNTDCDVSQYLIYRALCDYGTWYPCPDLVRGSPAGTAASYNNNEQTGGKGKKKPDCGGPFVLVGTLPQSVAQSRGNPTYFDDHTVPAGSPLCYAYLVKAQDYSQNISGRFPLPAVPPEVIVCQRLRDRTPPEPAIISGLFARDSAIQVDYIGPPVQDIAAYHVFRSDSGETGTYHWVGGMTVVPPPGTGTILTAPYAPPPLVGCDSIPLVSNQYMSAGTFLDRKVDRKRIYWYKVLGVDRSGNQSDPDSALAISTFTFAVNRETPPQISSVVATDDPCALTLTWSPAYDSTAMRGFFVFRGAASAGPYYQLEGLQKGNTFVDNSVARNTTYWYRVVMLKNDGMLTSLSDPKNGMHP